MDALTEQQREEIAEVNLAIRRAYLARAQNVAERDRICRQLHAQGASVAELARAAGCSRQRMSIIINRPA